MADELKITTIQLKRGTKAALEAKLKGTDMPKAGELIFEIPDDEDPTTPVRKPGKFKIGTHDERNDEREGHTGQLGDYINLPYLPTDESIQLVYAAVVALEGQAKTDAQDAETSKQGAAAAAVSAADAADRASEMPQKSVDAVKEYMDKKLWFGTVAEYNELENLEAGCYYFVTAED